MENARVDTDVTMAETVAPEDNENGTPPNDGSNDKKDDSNLTQASDAENEAAPYEVFDTTEEEPLIPKDEDKSPEKQNSPAPKATDIASNTEDEGIKQDDAADTTEADEGLFDEARPEATFSYTVLDFPNLKESALSPPTMVRNSYHHCKGNCILKYNKLPLCGKTQ